MADKSIREHAIEVVAELLEIPTTAVTDETTLTRREGLAAIQRISGKTRLGVSIGVPSRGLTFAQLLTLFRIRASVARP